MTLGIGELPQQSTVDAFAVELDVFQGPFDLLLQLIAKRELDITEVALAHVTDEFLEYMQRFPDLSSASEFLVVAATLLDMKAAQLLPRLEPEGELNFDEFQAQDLLFSRLLLYRAFKEAAAALAQRWDAESFRLPRQVALEPEYADLAPRFALEISPEQLASLAAAALTEPPRPDEAGHVAQPAASLSEEIAFVEDVLRHKHQVTFDDLVAKARNQSVVVTRFMAVLELYRRGLAEFVQPVPLGPLTVTLGEEHNG